MEIELLMEGALGKLEPESFTKQQRELGEKEQIKVEDYGDLVQLHLCPNGIISCVYEKGFVSLTAITSYAGAGFHHAALRLMQKIQEESEIDFSLQDSSNYLTHQDFELLEAHFYEWLEEMREQIIGAAFDAQFMIAWDHQSYEPQPKEAHVITPLGYLSYDEIAMNEAPELAQRVFVWNQIEKDASFYRNTALALLWKEGYFTYANMNETTKQIAHEIVDRFEIAYEKDAQIAIPMHAYSELCQVLGRTPQIRLAHKLDETTAFGYRRHHVYYPFHNWRIAAIGTCEKQEDAFSDALILIGPYESENAPWSWMMKATPVPLRKAAFEHALVMDAEGLQGSYRLIKEVDHQVLDAQIVHDEEALQVQFIYQEAALLETALALLKKMTYIKEETPKTQA